MDEGRKRKALDGMNPWTGRPYSSRYYEMLENRRALPVWRHKGEFLRLLGLHKVVIVVGDSGGGNTTQVPQIVLQAWNGRVACTQPWRVAAMTAAQRVADEMDVTLGEQVGYTVPLEECGNHNTVIMYMKDSMLLREAAEDPLFQKYKMVIVDEAHERTLATDILSVILKNAISKRKDLRLVVMSATDNTQENNFSIHFNNAPILMVPGRQLHPFECIYLPEPMFNYVEVAIITVVQIHTTRPAGDIIVFLPREPQVESVCSELSRELQGRDDVGPFCIVPLHDNLPLEKQSKVFEPAPVVWRVGCRPRKIVVSTKLAETSVTIHGIVYVIDAGLSNCRIHNPDTGVEALFVSDISQQSAVRRALIAGRTQAGMCFRLYTEDIFQEELPLETYPESLTLNLSSIALGMKNLGIPDLMSFKYMDSASPARVSVARALRDLYHLRAVNPEYNLEPLGEVMNSFPLDPQMSAMIIASPDYHCSNEIVSLSAMLLDRDSEWCKMNFIDAQVRNYAYNLRQKLVGIMRGLNIPLLSPASDSPWFPNNVKLAMLSGYFMQVAHRERFGYSVMLKDDNQVLDLDRTTFLNRRPEWVIYDEIHSNIARTVTDVQTEMLLMIARDYYDLRNIPRCAMKTAIERAHVFGLSRSGYQGLAEMTQVELQNFLEGEGMQWQTRISIPQAPAADEQGEGPPSPQ
ncbi:unnamed protein product [Triticum turgidum subsp. durum]|uniref:RNA helicase n=1 Tax=Triticum turgidum subsp. durum TaxID=4567 RepID=A0A9R0R7Q9_TRITD|nr:unnamed protein product [Triticum turgidum subsp. durum]